MKSKGVSELRWAMGVVFGVLALGMWGCGSTSDTPADGGNATDGGGKADSGSAPDAGGGNDGGIKPDGGQPPVCGAASQACCSNSTCNTGLSCTGGTCQAAPAGISGTVAGVNFAAHEAVALAIASTGACENEGLMVRVSNSPGTCARAQDACQGKKDLLELHLTVIDTNAIGPGTYDVVAPDPNSPPTAGVFVAMLSRTDSSCAPIDPSTLPRVSNGSVTITSASGNAISGSVSITFSDGGTLSGSLTTGGCAALRVDLCSPPSQPSCNGTLSCQ